MRLNQKVSSAALHNSEIYSKFMLQPDITYCYIIFFNDTG
jgi:hypothetical protein